MIQLIAPDCYEDFADDLHAMHRLRYRVFKERLDWQIRGRVATKSTHLMH